MKHALTLAGPTLVVWLAAALSLGSVASAQLPSADPHAGYLAGVNAAAEAGDFELLGKLTSGAVTVSIADIPNPGMSRNDGQGNGQIVVDAGMGPENTTIAILHEYDHIKNGDSGKTSTPAEMVDTMCDEARAHQAAADGAIDATSNPENIPPFRISCATKQKIIDDHNLAQWLCGGAPGTEPPPPDPEELGPVFAQMPCEGQ